MVADGAWEPRPAIVKVAKEGFVDYSGNSWIAISLPTKLSLYLSPSRLLSHYGPSVDV